MINPGFVYILLGILSLFIKEKLSAIISVILNIAIIILIYRLGESQELIYPFLDFELILLRVDNISRLIGLIFAFFALCTTIYSWNLVGKKYYILFNIYIGSSIAILFVGDFFSFHVFWEMMTISSYFLILAKDKVVTHKTSYYYFIMHTAGAISLLWGILLQYNATGSLELVNIERGLPFFIVAIGIKLACIPLHTWLPKVYTDVPFYISVLLSAYTTKVGVYSLYKILGRINLSYVGIATALIGVGFALKQSKVRKLLSYHIISQIGYMIVGIGVESSIGVAGSILHLVNNVLYKGLLFMVIGVVIYSTEEEDLINLGGLFRKLPLTTTYLIIAALSIAGAPFFSGHISKLLIKKAIDDRILIWGLYIAGIGTSLSFLKVVYFGFFRSRKEDIVLKRRPTKMMLVAMGMIGTIIMVIALKPDLLNNFFNIKKEMGYFSLKYMWKSMQPILIAVVVFKLAHDIIEPHHHRERVFDFYPYLGRGVSYLGEQLSIVHNGDLSRYIIWILTALALLLLKFLI